MKLYNLKKWKKKREKILRRDKYLCQLSLRYGKRVEADTVHHIFPIEFYPELMFVDWNLISLCSEEHNKLHSRDSHNLTEEGLRLLRRYENKYKKWCENHGKTPHAPL